MSAKATNKGGSTSTTTKTEPAVVDKGKGTKKTEEKPATTKKTEEKPAATKKTEEKKKTVAEPEVKKAVEPVVEPSSTTETETETSTSEDSDKKKKRTVYKPEDYDAILERFEHHIKESFELKHAFIDIFKKYEGMKRQIDLINGKKQERSKSIKERGVGIMQKCTPSKELSDFLKLGKDEMIAQTDAVSKISKYITDKGLKGKEVPKTETVKDKDGKPMKDKDGKPIRQEVKPRVLHTDNSYINIDKDPALLKLFPEAKGKNDLKFINISGMVGKHLTRPPKEEKTE